MRHLLLIKSFKFFPIQMSQPCWGMKSQYLCQGGTRFGIELHHGLHHQAMFNVQHITAKGLNNIRKGFLSRSSVNKSSELDHNPAIWFTKILVCKDHAYFLVFVFFLLFLPQTCFSWPWFRVDGTLFAIGSVYLSRWDSFQDRATVWTSPPGNVQSPAYHSKRSKQYP